MISIMRKNKEYSSIYGKSEHMSSDKKYARFFTINILYYISFLNKNYCSFRLWDFQLKQSMRQRIRNADIFPSQSYRFGKARWVERKAQTSSEQFWEMMEG